jgi:hypothetical protein
MSPDRLNRHDWPDDNITVLWGDIRTLSVGYVRRYQHALIVIVVIATIAIAISIGTGVAVGFLIHNQDKNTERIEQAVCATVFYSERQSRNLPKGATAHQLRELGKDMRATGIRCKVDGSDRAGR